MIWAAVALCGGVGALARYELADRVAQRVGGTFPTGTLAVNVLGSFLTGAVWGLDPSRAPALLLGTGFLGGFTTFSTWMVETGRLIEEDATLRRGILNVALMLAGGMAGGLVGSIVGRI